MSKIEKFIEDLMKVESLLEKMELTTPEDAKKAASILEKMATFASKDKYLSGNFNHFSGILCYLKKDYKQALSFFSKSIVCSENSGTSHGFDHLWKAYTHLALNDLDATYTELNLAYKKNKKIVAKIKSMKDFAKIKEQPEYKKALGIKSNSENVDLRIQKLIDYVLENSDLNYLKFLKMLDKEKAKIEDKHSLYDAQIWAAEALIEDALEHGLRDQDFYDEGPYTLKQLKILLKTSKENRKELGRSQSYFYKMIKS